MRQKQLTAARWAAPMALVLAAAYLAAGAYAPHRAEAASYVVTMFTDVVKGEGCQQAHQGGCTLREAIIAANSGSAAATITFEIPGSAVPVINVGGTGLGPLPEITTRVTLDATTQSAGYVRIHWAGAELAADGLRVSAGDSTVRGLAIYSFPGNGIVLSGAGGNTIADTIVGTSDGASGGPYGNTGHGILIAGSPDNVIGPGAVVSNNGGDGIHIDGTPSGAGGNTITGSFIGTDDTGTGDLGNAGNGIRIIESAGNTAGGTEPSARNVISGNTLSGVLVEGAGSTGNVIAGNHIGTNFPGGGPLPNGAGGVDIAGAANNTVGGTAQGARNVIAGNTGYGVRIRDAGAGSNTVAGNYIGMDANGNIAQGNSGDGVLLDGAPGNSVGGGAAGAGNLISGNGGNGVHVSGAAATGNTVMGNYIGTDAAGAIARGNAGRGVWLESVSGNTIGYGAGSSRNVISGNGAAGIEVSAAAPGGHADNNWVLGNYIGASADGGADVGNAGHGVFVHADDPTATATANTIGAAAAAATAGDPGAGNVISGNGGDGVRLSGAGAGGNAVAYNRIGTDAGGAQALGNTGTGVRVIDSPDNAVEGNAVSGNATGIHISGLTATGNSLLGNYIGTSADGGADLGNSGDGVHIEGAPDNRIGSTPAPLAGGGEGGNVIAGNAGHGVWLDGADAAGNVVARNYIGTNAAGAVLGNGGHGVLTTGVPGADIGGEAEGAGNAIAYNGGDGVSAEGASAGIAVRRNDIADNGGLGIDLAPDGVTANDAGDADTGVNGLQNAPVLALAENPGAHITGSLDTVPGEPFRIEFFASSACDSSGRGEGQHFIGWTNVTTDGTGHAAIEVTFIAHAYTGDVVTATATSVAGNTSEFSPCVTATGPVVPTPTPIGQTPTPTPTPTPVPTITPTPTPRPDLNGDADCDADVDTIDSLGVLRFVAGLSPLAQQEPCPEIGADHNGRPFGDVDCSAAVDTIDALRILRHAGGLPPLAAPEGCPVVGT